MALRDLPDTVKLGKAGKPSHMRMVTDRELAQLVGQAKLLPQMAQQVLHAQQQHLQLFALMAAAIASAGGELRISETAAKASVSGGAHLKTAVDPLTGDLVVKLVIPPPPAEGESAPPTTPTAAPKLVLAHR